MAPPGLVRERLAARLAAHGIDIGRVALPAFRPPEQYLGTYREIDLALDTFPYSATPRASMRCGWACCRHARGPSDAAA
ncbi:hypothetical protein [Paraburkholderia kururiensis]|uniref:hypothetical protein n=1 Tax=Paraburkholderia kururiensis TaxID=984307 RepID=UPI000ACD19CA|nr:hypothetical protein [Paraburkholderia kururiensis]